MTFPTFTADIGDSDLSCVDMLYLYDGQDEIAETILKLQFENEGEGFVILVSIWKQSDSFIIDSELWSR